MTSPNVLRMPSRGQHAAPARFRWLLPALLLGVPVSALLMLQFGHGGTPAHLEHLRLTALSAGPTREVAAPPVANDWFERLAGPPVALPAPAPAEKRAAPSAPGRPRPSAPARASRGNDRSGWVMPVYGRLTSRFAPRWGRFHSGVDIAAPTGRPVRAAAAGEVITAGWGGAYGWLVRLQHADGTVTAYAHMSRILVSGTHVGAGEVIGRVGSTGRSTGPHLHFEVRTAGLAINPLSWLRRHGVDI